MDCGHIVGGEATAVLIALMGVMVALTAIIVTVILTLAYCRIFSKAGFCWAWGLLMLVPIVNMVVLLVLTFSDWPVLRELRQLRQQSGAGKPQAG